MKKIKLTNNKFTLVDNKDYKKLIKFKWYAWFDGYNWYALRNKRVNNKRKTIRMHRIIINAKQREIVDHKNSNTLDNRKANLRKCSASNNQMNRTKTKRNKSGFKGVWWNKNSKKWQVKIVVNGKRIHLGYYKDKLFAATVYRLAAQKLHKEFAKW